MSPSGSPLGSPCVELIERGAISQFKSFASSSKHDEIGPESFGIFACRFVGTVPDILGLFWPSFRFKPGSKSKMSGRVFQTFRGPFSSAEPGCLGKAGELSTLPFEHGDGSTHLPLQPVCEPYKLLMLGFSIHGFEVGREPPIWGVWAAPAAPKTIPKGWGRRPPTFWDDFWGRQGRPHAKHRRFPAGPKAMY